MKRKIISSITALTLALSMVTTTLGNPILINYNGLTQILEETSNENGLTYVEGTQLSDVLGLEYNFSTTNRSVTLSKNGNTLVMNYNSPNAKFNDKTIGNAPKTIVEDGVVMLPLRFVSEAFGDTVAYDSEKKVIAFSNDEEYLSNIKNIGKATSTTSKVYTYKEALNKAKNSNTTIDELISAIDTMESNLEVTEYAISINGIQSGNVFTSQLSEDQFMSMLSTAYTLENSISDTEYTIKILETASELGLLSSLTSLTLTELSIVLLEESLELAETDLKNLKIKLDLGLATETEVVSKTNEIEKSKLSIEQAKADLKKAKESLNKTMGIAQKSDIVVEFDPVIEKTTFDVEKVVSKARTLSGSVVSAESKLKNAEYALDLEHNMSIFESENDEEERAVGTAKRELANAKTEVEASVRSTYNNFEKARLADKSLRIAREDAVTQYNNLVVNYNAGYVTKNMLEQAKLGITSAEFNILQNLLQYNIYRFQLEHPELF